MKKLLALQLKYYPASAHAFFFELLESNLDAAGEAVRAAVAPLMPNFRARLADEQAVLGRMRSSEITGEIAAAGAAINNLLAVVNGLVRVARRATDEEVRAAAKRVYHMLKSRGNIAREPYPERAGATELVLQSFAGDYAPEVALLGLTAQVQQLREALTAFRTLTEQRNKEQAAKPAYNARTARRNLLSAYRPIEHTINAHALAGVSPDFEAFIIRFNPTIEGFNQEFHRVRYALDKSGQTMIDNIPRQRHTGKPVTPVPRVFYRLHGEEFVELWLGRDFTLSYRNNVKVGTAWVIIHGKGAYKGSTSVQFDIAAPTAA